MTVAVEVNHNEEEIEMMSCDKGMKARLADSARVRLDYENSGFDGSKTPLLATTPAVETPLWTDGGKLCRHNGFGGVLAYEGRDS